jgi:sugar/nucleoside kinase (ribokinase family)
MRNKVVSLGVHIVDILGRHVESIPSGQNLGLIDEIRITVAGTAGGTSVDLAKLGMQVFSIGATGKDELANFMRSTLSHYGVDTVGLIEKTGIQTSATMLPIRPNGERPALHVVGANGELTIDDINFEMISACDYLHVGGVPLLTKLNGEPISKVLKYAKDHGVTTTFDVLAINRPDLLELIEPSLPYIDYFMPGLEEVQMMTEIDDRLSLIDFFLDKGVGCTVFKMGSEGSSVAYRENGKTVEKLIPIIENIVVDSTGCGDSYCAGFITGLSHGWSLEECAQFGSACGSLVIGGLGSDAGIVDFKSTYDYMKQHFSK